MELASMRVLIADDNEPNAALLRQILADAGYSNVGACADPRAVVSTCLEGPIPDLLVLDLQMPTLSGFEVLGSLRPVLTDEPFLAVLVVTANVTQDARRRALSLGARDFITKPVDPTEFLLRTAHLLRTHQLRSALRDMVATRTAELEQARLQTLQHLLIAAECRDDTTGQHTIPVGRTAQMLAAAMSLPEARCSAIAAAAPLHDVGKIGIPDEILLKAARLDPQELAVMRRHVEIGARILGSGQTEHLSLAHEIARHHHERWDGNGYLLGLRGTQIPLAARITAVADVFDALTHERPYKDAWPVDAAVCEVLRQAGEQFDPDVVRAFATLDHEELAHPSMLGSGGIVHEHPLRSTGAGVHERLVAL
jgi:putative two-component system response regulator